MDPNSQGGLPQAQVNQPFQPYPLQPGAVSPMPGAMPNLAKHHRPWGLIIALIVSVLLLFGALAFGVWAFVDRSDYKNKSDQKSAAAAEIAVQQEGAKKDKEFLEKEKSPYKLYEGPEAYGSIKLTYPKTWSAYVLEATRSGTVVDGYFHPGFVPNVTSGTAFALRLQVSSQTYDQELKQFEPSIKAGKIKLSPYISQNVPGVTGAKLTGELTAGKNAVLVLLPIRDKTIKISAEAPQFFGDFDNIILQNLKFVP